MKKTLLTILILAGVASVGMAQTNGQYLRGYTLLTNPPISKVDTIPSTDTVAAIPYHMVPKYDTVRCYFNEISGIKKGKLYGIWRKGFLVTEHGKSYFLTTDSFKPFYLYADKKTKALNPVIQSYQ